jgi:hypothetical protein
MGSKLLCCKHARNVVSLFECVGKSYCSTIEKGRPAAYPVSILKKTESTNILWDSTSISK